MIAIKSLGVHEDILTAEFGTGDILITKARKQDEEYQSMLMFYNQVPKEIGSETDILEGKTSDELPRPQFILSFRNPESINALIHSLSELQKEVFKLRTPLTKKSLAP